MDKAGVRPGRMGLGGGFVKEMPSLDLTGRSSQKLPEEDCAWS